METRRDVKRRLKEVGVEAARSETDVAELKQEIQRAWKRIAKLEAELARPRLLTLPLGEAPPGMQYGAGLIELCVNLAREVGLRPAVRALKTFFRWLKVNVAIPVYQAIRLWMQRLGLGRMKNARRADGGLWITDHTNQIGKEKVLTVLRVPQDRPREAGPLRQEEMEVLTVLPGESWKRENVLEVYRKTAERCGTPRAIASDGAAELQDPIGMLVAAPAKTPEKPPKQPLAIRDPKHFLANRLEALLTRDPAWQEFAGRLGGTRSAVQQTELAHFAPPIFKAKARFMNLAATLRWANVVLRHLDRPQSRSRRGIAAERLQDKLGWLRDFAPKLREWQACQDVVGTALRFLNERGLYRGATRRLRKLVAKFEKRPPCRQLIQALVKFLQGYEDRLQPREQLPVSTEILESCYAKYKQLEQQHSKGGFTTLLLTFPVLLRPTTAAEITAGMQRVKVADVHAWKKEFLPATLTSRRQLLYREAKPKTKSNHAKQIRATPISNNN